MIRFACRNVCSGDMICMCVYVSGCVCVCIWILCVCLCASVCVRSAFDPSRTILPPGPSRSSGQLLSARGPSEPSVWVTDGQENVLFFACFFLLGFLLEST